MKTQLRFKPRNGFALVVTVSMMVLLTIVVVATLSLSTVTLRSVDRGAAQAVARANARLAMMIAIGQLQKYAGPDQRVTATAQVFNENSPNPQWTGVWTTEEKNKKDKAEAWLVSGGTTGMMPEEQDAMTERNSALLASVPQTDLSRKELRAPYVEVKGTKMDGRFAYWVGDEGVKARVDIAKPTEDIPKNQVALRTARNISPQEAGLEMFDEDNKALWGVFKESGSGNPLDRSSLVSLGTVGIATETKGAALTPQDVPKHYFNDLTTGGMGLPVNVKDGGMKADLSLIFDHSSDGNAAMLRRYLGTTPTKDVTLNTYQTTTGISDPKKYFLSDLLSKNGTSRTGPNWGSLYSYGRLWENVGTDNKTQLIGALPRPSSDLRMDNWAPYSNDTGGEFAMDPQHGNSSITPVISMLQFTVRVRARGPYRGTSNDPPNGIYYVPQLEIKPIIGIWNPYNVSLASSSYLINWALAPYMRLAHSLNGGHQDITEAWLREYWMTGRDKTPTGSVVTLPTEGAQKGGYFNLQTPAITMAPGEFRLFSIAKSEPLAANDQNLERANMLVETLGEAGGFYMDIMRSANYSGPDQKMKEKFLKGTELKVPAGSDIWFGAITMQDTQMETQEIIEWGPGVGTKAHFQNKLGPSATSSWVTLKSGNLHLNRYTNLWNGGTDQRMGTPVGNNKKFFVPEHVRHSQHSTAQTARRFKIDNLGYGDVGHLASWRISMRTATDGQAAVNTKSPNQGLRGWIDSNPRAMAGSPRFDGSRINGNEMEGWSFLSAYTGGLNEYGGMLGEGKGKGGYRGLVKEGELGELSPPGDQAAGKGWTGYGGGGPDLLTGGVKNVIIYDVPRGPLTSVGQFQHAQLSRYNYEPGFVVGNSYADVRIPLGQTMVENYAKGYYAGTAPGFRLVDISYEVNNRIWDSVFFSTMAPDYGAFSNYSSVDMKSYSDGTKELPNPRMLLTPLPGDTSVDDIIKQAGDRAPEALASRIAIKGAFNVHSTSKEAWKAILSSMGSSEIPTIPVSSGSASPKWVENPGVHFSRLSYPGSESPFEAGKATSISDFWLGWRKLSADELDKLAEEIVKEVKERGPFRSMAEFVNRNPNAKGADSEQQEKGALQAALDRTLNNLPNSTGAVAMKPDGNQFPTSPGTTRQSAGYPGNMLQGDILQALAPILQVRSDYFRIRTCGEALDKNGNVLAKVWCEAFVQRTGDYLNNADKPEIAYLDLSNEVNKLFGRRFQLVSFRWLAPSEI